MKGKIFLVLLAMVVLMPVVGCSVNREEKKAEFSEWYAELQPAEITQEAIEEQVLGRARPVETKIFFEKPLEEAFVLFEIPEKLNAKKVEEAALAALKQLGAGSTKEQKRAAAEAAIAEAEQRVLTIEEILEDESLKQEGRSLFPSMVEVLQDNVVRFPIPGYMFGFDSPLYPPGIATLLRESAVVTPEAYFVSCNMIVPEETDDVLITSALLANAELEDHWRKETLFDGTAKEICAKEASSLIDMEKGMAVFKRPGTKAFQVKEEPLLLGSVEELELGQKLYFARFAETGKLEVAVAMFDGTLETTHGAKVVKFFGRFDPLKDGGTALYYVDKNMKLRLVAFATALDLFGIEAKYILEGIEGF